MKNLIKDKLRKIWLELEHLSSDVKHSDAGGASEIIDECVQKLKSVRASIK